MFWKIYTELCKSRNTSEKGTYDNLLFHVRQFVRRSIFIYQINSQYKNTID
jgi:hypothetical protein